MGHRALPGSSRTRSTVAREGIPIKSSGGSNVRRLGGGPVSCALLSWLASCGAAGRFAISGRQTGQICVYRLEFWCKPCSYNPFSEVRE